MQQVVAKYSEGEVINVMDVPYGQEVEIYVLGDSNVVILEAEAIPEESENTQKRNSMEPRLGSLRTYKVNRNKALFMFSTFTDNYGNYGIRHVKVNVHYRYKDQCDLVKEFVFQLK